MHLDLSRRAWLKYTTAFTLAGLVGACDSNRASNGIKKEDVLLGGGRYLETADGPMNFVLASFRPQTKKVTTINMPFFPHGMTPVKQEAQVYLFQKIGLGAGLVDLKKGEFISAINPVKNRLFYGHGAVRNDLLYSTETAPDEQGAIGIRDAKSLQYLGDFPTYGAHPHDCHLVDNEKLLVVTNGGGEKGSNLRPCVCYIDINSQRLIEKIEMPDDRFNTGHIFPLGQYNSIVVSAPRRGLDKRHIGAVSLQGKSESLKVLNKPQALTQRLLGESLSVVAIPEHDLFVVTHPTPGLVTFWQLSSQKLLQTLNLPSARGLALAADNASVWVSFGPRASVVKVSLAKLVVDKSTETANTFFTGSHLLNIHSI